MCYVAIDTETTGLMPSMNEVVEVALIVCNDRLIETGRVSFRMDIERPQNAEARALEICGYDKHTWNPKFKSHADGLNYLNKFIDFAISEFSSAPILVGQNVKFDLGFMNEEYKRAGIVNPFSKMSLLDLQEVAQVWAAYKGVRLKYRRLSYFCELANIVNERAHSAEGDVEATLASMRVFLLDLKAVVGD